MRPLMRKLRHVSLVVVPLVMMTFFLFSGTASAASVTSAHPATFPAHAASSGFVQVTQQNFRKYIHSPLAHDRVSPHISDAAPGPYLFTDNIYSVANGLYVAAELGYTGGNYAMLRARTSPSKVDGWEVFNWYGGTSSNTFEIQSNANGLFVAAELGYTGGNYAMLRARTSSSKIDGWEQFYWYYNSTTGISLIESAANNLFVAAELGYTGGNYAMLRARTSPSKVDGWEQFIV